jgi:hypothetical protein
MFLFNRLFVSMLLYSSSPEHFTSNISSFRYYHAHEATQELIEQSAEMDVIFEFDLSIAYNALYPKLKKGAPFIGHPEIFYTSKELPFPVQNLSFEELKDLAKELPHLKILIDVKDWHALPALEQFIQEIGPHRCIVHAFIAEWVTSPKAENPEAHWFLEDVPLKDLDRLLTKYQVPLIANARIFPNAKVADKEHLMYITERAKYFPSIFAIGFYKDRAPIPEKHLLEQINSAGYYAWVNANQPDYQEKTQGIIHIGMCDDISQCTNFSRS